MEQAGGAAPAAPLHVWNNDHDWVIASTVEDAKVVLDAELGIDCDLRDFSMEPDGKLFTCWLTRNGALARGRAEKGARKAGKTAGEWAAHFGRGYAWTDED